MVVRGYSHSYRGWCLLTQEALRLQLDLQIHTGSLLIGLFHCFNDRKKYMINLEIIYTSSFFAMLGGKKKKRGGVEGWSSGRVVLYINNNDGCRLSIILRIISIAGYFF